MLPAVPAPRFVAPLALAIALFVPSCRRQAPGPAECHAFALRAAGIRSEAIAEADPRLRQVVEEMTVRCLTTPFDRELLACARDPSVLRPCFAAFQARHPERAQRSLPSRN
jgi:hypothetical protein